MKALWNRLSVGGRLCLAVIAAYFLCAAWGGVRSLRARLADETPAYNVVDVSARYQAPSAAHWITSTSVSERRNESITPSVASTSPLHATISG